jgi:Na+/melibiose symporter-like transporter
MKRSGPYSGARIAVAEHLVDNERVKLQATTLNGMAIACLITSVIQNVFVNALNDQSKMSTVTLVSVSVGFGIVGFVLHILANLHLRNLREKTAETGVSNDTI